MDIQIPISGGVVDMAEPAPIRLLLVDDYEMVREGLRLMLECNTQDVIVVAVAAGGQEGLDMAGTVHPDVVLMDIRMPEWTGSRRQCY